MAAFEDGQAYLINSTDPAPSRRLYGGPTPQAVPREEPNAMPEAMGYGHHNQAMLHDGFGPQPLLSQQQPYGLSSNHGQVAPMGQFGALP